jgi:hypothetical protein
MNKRVTDCIVGISICKSPFSPIIPLGLYGGSEAADGSFPLAYVLSDSTHYLLGGALIIIPFFTSRVKYGLKIADAQNSQCIGPSYRINKVQPQAG